jgi:hypothetical protein
MRSKSLFALAFVAGTIAAVPATAQTPTPKTATDLVNSILVRVVEDASLSDAQFAERQRVTREAIAAGVATALANYPLGASSAGLAYLEQQGSEPVLKSTSFGSFFVERSVTNGRGNLNLGISYHHSAFDKLQGVDFKNVGLPNQSATGKYADGTGVGDTYFTKLDVKSQVFVFSGSYGVSDALDIGWAVPLASLSVRGQLLREYDAGRDCLQVSPTCPTEVFEEVSRLYPGRAGTQVRVDQTIDASGIGDLMVRTKYGFGQSTNQIAMISAELRLPTGDEENMLGTGETTFKFMGGSTKHLGSASVSVNGGYTAGLTDEFNLAVGTDVALLSRKQLTVSVDLVSQRLFDTVTSYAQDVTGDTVALVGNPPRRITWTYGKWNTGDTTLYRAAIGAKYNVAGNWLLTGAGIFRLNDNGFQSTVTAFVGLERTWNR